MKYILFSVQCAECSFQVKVCRVERPHIGDGLAHDIGPHEIPWFKVGVQKPTMAYLVVFEPYTLKQIK